MVLIFGVKTMIVLYAVLCPSKKIRFKLWHMPKYVINKIFIQHQNNINIKKNVGAVFQIRNDWSHRGDLAIYPQ